MLDLPTQYRTITSGAGWLVRADRGRLRFDGADRASFLQALVTNDVSAEGGRGTYALYLTPQGRMITDMRIYPRVDHLIVDVPAALAAGLASRFDQLIFADDVRVADVSSGIAQVGVVGIQAPATLAGVVSLPAPELAALPILSPLAAGDGFVVRTDDADVPSFDVFVPAERRDEVVRRLTDAGAVEAPQAVLDALRLEAGRPAFGIDMTEETIPLEAGLLDRAISLTKGCYVGQEVIVRVLHRGGGRVAKRLVVLEFDPEVADVPAAGAPIVIDGKDAGRVTSAAISPARARVLALGYVRREQAEAGQRASVGDRAATIVRHAS